MSEFLTDGRTALLARLQADATMDSTVRTWFSWGPGILQRFDILPVNCPLVSVVPANLPAEELSNIVDKFPQDVEIGIATDGQDAEPCETLIVRALSVVYAANRDCLELSAQGLASVRPVNCRWQAEPNTEDGRVMWYGVLNVRLTWLWRP